MGTFESGCRCNDKNITLEKNNEIIILTQQSKSTVLNHYTNGMNEESEKNRASDEMKNTETNILFSSRFQTAITPKESIKGIEKLQAMIKGVLFRFNFISYIKNELISEEKELINKITNEYTCNNVKLAESMHDISNNQNYKIKICSVLSTKILLQQIHQRNNYNITSSHLASSCINNDITMDSLYIGHININNVRHGYGSLLIKNGSKYTGYWLNGEFSGYGTLITKNGTLYQGFFTNWKLSGQGIKKTLNHYNYEGNFENFLRQGLGVEETEQHIYRGEFKNDQKTGKGEVTYKKGNEYYKGEFKDNVINGQGEYKWGNGSWYRGDFIDGKMDGKGVYKMENGTMYEGEYHQGVREGKGKYKWSNGTIFEGIFIKGKPDGKGILTVNEKNHEVFFHNGKLDDQYKDILKGKL